MQERAKHPWEEGGGDWEPFERLTFMFTGYEYFSLVMDTTVFIILLSLQKIERIM